MPYKKITFGTVTLALAIVFATSCNNDAEKAAPAEAKKPDSAAPATTAPPDTSAKKVMDTTAAQRPTKPGA